MKLICLLLLSTAVVLMANAASSNVWRSLGATDVFFNTSKDCSDFQNPCDWNDPTNWVGNILPINTSNVVIDYSTLPNLPMQYINIASNDSALVNNINIRGSNVELSCYSTQCTVLGTFYSDSGANFALHRGNLYVSGSFQLQGASSFQIVDGFLNTFGSVLVDTNVHFAAAYVSGVSFDLDINNPTTQTIVFNSQPIISGKTNFAVSGPNATFNMGINGSSTTGMFIMNNTYLYQTSTMQILRVLDTMNLMAGATLSVSNQLVSAPGVSINVNQGDLVVGNGDSGSGFMANIMGTITSENYGSVTFANFPGNVTVYQLLTNGPLTVDNVPMFNIGYDLDQMQSNITVLNIAGSSYFTIDLADISYMSIVASSMRTARQKCSISFTSICNIGRAQTYLNNTIFQVLDGATLSLEGDISFVGTSGIYLYGEMTILKDIAFDQDPQLNIYGGAASLRTENVTINGTITMIDGLFMPVLTTIQGDFDQIGGTLLFANAIGENLLVTGDFTSTVNGTIAFSDAIQPDSDSVIMVEGQVSITDNLIIQFMETSPMGNIPYYIMSSLNNPIQGMFSFAEVQWSATKIIPYTYDIYVTNPANELILNFKAPPAAPHKHLPGWAVFLIVLAVLSVIVIAFLGFRFYRRNQGYIRL